MLLVRQVIWVTLVHPRYDWFVYITFSQPAITGILDQMLFGVRVYPAHCRVFPNIPDYYALDGNSMVPVVTTKKCLQMSNFLLETIGLGGELLFYIYSNLQYFRLFSHRWKPSRLAEENPEVKAEAKRKVGNCQQKASSLYSRQKGRPSISWLNCLSMIAWLASFSTRASSEHFSQKLTLPTFRVKWKSSNLIVQAIV